MKNKLIYILILIGGLLHGQGPPPPPPPPGLPIDGGIFVSLLIALFFGCSKLSNK